MKCSKTSDMIRKKEKIKGQTFDNEGGLVDCETEVEEIICESVGDILDILEGCPRSATVFMVPPRKGDNIQKVQVFDCCEVEHKFDDEITLNGVRLRKAFSFTIGEHGPYEMLECYKKQRERELEMCDKSTKSKLKEDFRKLAPLFTYNQKNEAQNVWNLISYVADEIDSLKQEVAELKQQLNK